MTTTLEKYLVGLIVLLVSSGALAGWWALHNRAEQKIGMAVCEKQDAGIVATAQAQNATAETTQAKDDSKAEQKLNDALKDPVDSLPPIPSGVQPAAATSCPSAVPHTRSITSPSPAAAIVRAEPPAAVVQPDWKAIERSDVQSAHNADATVTYLEGLLAAQYKLCGGKPVP